MIIKIINFFKRYSFQLIKKSTSNPISNKIIANDDEYIKLFNNLKNINYQEINNFEKKKNFFINKQWLENLALKTQISKKKTKNNFQHGRVLYSSLSNYIKKLNSNDTINVLETGTSAGFSSLCMAKAFFDCKHDNYRIITLDIIPHETPIFWNKIGDQKGKRTRVDILKEWKNLTKNIIFLSGDNQHILENLKIFRINLAFLDAVHNIKYLSKEFNYVKSRQVQGDVIIFDDINTNQYPELVDFLKKLEKQSDYNIEYLSSSNERGYAIATRL